MKSETDQKEFLSEHESFLNGQLDNQDYQLPTGWFNTVHTPIIAQYRSI